ncbi:hypothetical protein ASD11_09620 [Aeromicrobium sp. Root495]|uniref:TetR/AcrR family transcriptional regulator n=1 Tax=Aeromicrobium sp. Root495 TaxID=1736550 RepID=UPI0006F4E468|nr:TetR/AcrR family transcriptional regulator [Aeromicrobium sp. Root495]KQY59784.1 hypothetical protein ASD11_09620 [Aeromicrobium sp. Root495]
MTAETRQRLVDAAVALTRRQGIAGTTVADLLHASGVARRTLYLHFVGGRDELLVEGIRSIGQSMTENLTAVLGTRSASESIDTFVGSMRAGLTAGQFRSGCPILQAALGGADIPQASKDAGLTMTRWSESIARRLEADGVAEDRARSLAHLVVAGIEGAVAMGVATGSAGPLDDVGRLLLELIGSEDSVTA